MPSTPDVETLAPIFSDPELRVHLKRRATEFIDAVFDTAMEALEDGDGATRAAYMKMIMPHLLKLEKEQGEEGIDAEKVKEETREMFAAVGAALRAAEADNDA